MKRRTLIGGAIGTTAAAALWWQWRGLPVRGLLNPCLPATLPAHLSDHPALLSALEALDMQRVTDCHVHLLGTGDQLGGEVWINPQMDDPLHPYRAAQKALYMNASCPTEEESTDSGYVSRLAALDANLRGSRTLLMAFDYHHTVDGQPDKASSTYYVANTHAKAVADTHEGWGWICSVHPYREDAIEVLQWCAENGARAVKWLPPAMGMNPSSPRCDAFYKSMREFNLPLLTHGGDELAVHGEDHQHFGNPLLLRRPLEHGVRVVVAHCASLGTGEDLRQSAKTARRLPNFELWRSMMQKPDWEGLLFGELSATTQINRAGVLSALLEADDLHPRLLNGSDYPLVGIPALFSASLLINLGLIERSTAGAVFELQRYNPLMFDLVLKRSLRWQGKGFSRAPFESASFFDGTPKP
jgi:mannonate dehydratase